MGRAQTDTLLPLDSWAAIMGINLFEFNQIGEGFPEPNTAQCPHVWYQYQWQEDFLSREEIAKAIAMAEQAIAEQLGYWPAPKAITNERVSYPRIPVRNAYGRGGNPRGQYKSVSLAWSKIQGGGSLVRTLIGADTVTFSDPDGDSVNERFTASIATSVTDPNEIAVYFNSADRLGEDIAEQWRIRPVKVTISGGVATIVGHSSLLVLPNKEVITNPEVLDVSAAIYATEVDIYRLYRDDTSTDANPAQGFAHWENAGCDEPPCAAEYHPVCIGAREADSGVVSVNYNVVDGFCQDTEPDWLVVNYIAGEPLVNGQMSVSMAHIVAHLATALLPDGNCACDRSNRIIAYWKDLPGDPDKSRFMTQREIDDNPFGDRRGSRYAWERVKMLLDVRGATV